MLTATLSLPATASAESVEVDNLGDLILETGCTEGGEDCSLREAIEKANGDPELDTIVFSVAGTIEPTGPLPAIEEGLTIDATTAPGYSGSPVFEIEGGGFGTGLRVQVGETVIEGLAIEGFETGIRVAGATRIVAGRIANNGGEGGGGIVIAGAAAAIRANSIFANFGPGITYEAGTPPPSPVLESVASTVGSSTVLKGSLTSDETETFALDFFANDACDESGAGEGAAYLGSAAVATKSGSSKFEATLPLQPEGTVLTATATEEAGKSTSEFSRCIVAPAPGPAPAPIIFTSTTPTPENGESVVVAPVQGNVFVTLPGSKKKVLLKEGQEIPVGSIVDATGGKVTLSSIDKAGNVQTAVFFGGVFKIKQRKGSGLVVLELRDSLAGCKRSRRRARHSRRASAAASGRKHRAKRRRGGRLWGSGKGKFRTKGHYGAATVRGTVWLTEDRCNGTLFKVKRGVVKVRDFGDRRTFRLRKGKSYLAKP